MTASILCRYITAISGYSDLQQTAWFSDILILKQIKIKIYKRKNNLFASEKVYIPTTSTCIQVAGQIIAKIRTKS